MNHLQELKQLFDEGIIDEVDIFISSHKIKDTITIDLFAQEVKIVANADNFENLLGKVVECVKSEKKRLNL